jgi:hypothetical protein
MCSLVVVIVLTEWEGYQKTELQATILCLSPHLSFYKDQ